MRILIVEDDVRLSVNISAILKKTAYAVDLATTAAQATDKLLSPDYDLIILDWKLPDGSGLDICRQLRADYLHSHSGPDCPQSDRGQS